MEEAKLTTLAQIKAFIDGTLEVAFRIPRKERNQFIERVFKRFGYAPHGRADKGVLLRYIERMTDYHATSNPSGAHTARMGSSPNSATSCPRNGFACHYTLADVALLAEVDALHSTLSGPPPRSSWSVRTKCLAMRASSVWQASLFPPVQPARKRPYQNKRRH